MKGPTDPYPTRSPLSARRRRVTIVLVLFCICGSIAGTIILLAFVWTVPQTHAVPRPIDAERIIQRCHALHLLPQPPQSFYNRTRSDRFVDDTTPVLLRNASIWTGGGSHDRIIYGDLLMDRGLIRHIGHVGDELIQGLKDVVIHDVAGKWVTPGIIDMHSHIGILSLPILKGSDDTNSLKGLIQPWLRSLDGLNTHDDAYSLSIAGGVTTSLVLPGSTDAIGGQAFVIKLRPTQERTPSSMALELPFVQNGTTLDFEFPPRWRNMKHAFGESPKTAYDNTRMDDIWALREAYETARKIKERQDDFCSRVLDDDWHGIGQFPEDLRWEALVDVLRGRVKVHAHCYEAVDLEALVRLTNEFKFPLAAFHHAHEAYLVPDLLKQAYGGAPAVALFAINARYKREAYRGSQYAPRILADNGLNVVMKSDHPVMDSRYLVHEAQQAHFYGLEDDLALASVTSTPAKVLGLDHRIGHLRSGYDADVVLWDSHPLALGATPVQVWIDGISQLDFSDTLLQQPSKAEAPRTPDFNNEVILATVNDGLPPLNPRRPRTDLVVFSNVSNILVRSQHTIEQLYSATAVTGPGYVVVGRNGAIVCQGSWMTCSDELVSTSDAEWIDLQNGFIVPGLTTFGSALGLQDILNEPTTNDGSVVDVFNEAPSLLDQIGVVSAVDGLQFGTRDALLAYRAGVTAAVVSPRGEGLLSGRGVAFATGASHRLETGAVLHTSAGLHVSVRHYDSGPSVSTQIGVLRSLMLRTHVNVEAFVNVLKGKTPLVVKADNADIIATLIELKREIEEETQVTLRMTIVGAAEAHLLADELATANIGVIVTSPRPFPLDWQSKRILPGPPLSRHSLVTALIRAGVQVGIGVKHQAFAGNIRFDLGWTLLEDKEYLSHLDALAMATVNIERLLGIESDSVHDDVLAVRGGSLLDFSGKVVGIFSPRRGIVDLL